MRAGGGQVADLPRRRHPRAAPDAWWPRRRRWWRRCARLLAAPLFAAAFGVRLAQLRMRALVCAARPVPATERSDCKRLLDHDRPFVHNELRQRADGDLPLVQVDGGEKLPAGAAQRANGIAAPPGRTHTHVHTPNERQREEQSDTVAKSPFHRKDVGRQLAQGALPLRRVVSMSQPRLRTRRQSG